MSDIPITRYADLREGDEFIRVGGYPILLRDITGRRTENSQFWPDGFGSGYYAIYRMVLRPGCWLGQECLTTFPDPEERG